MWNNFWTSCEKKWDEKGYCSAVEQVEESVHTSQQIKLTFQKRNNNWVRKKKFLSLFKLYHHGMFQDMKNI